MNAPARVPAIGDNKPPLATADQLAKDFAHVEAFVVAQEAKAKAVPPVAEDDDDLALISAAVIDLRKAEKRCDALREETKRPYLDAGNVVQTYFKALEARLTQVKADIEDRGTRYLKKKEAAERARQAEIERRQREEAAKLEREALEAAKASKPDEAKTAMAAATQAQVRADTAASVAAARPAELARTRTVGGTGTLLETFEVSIIDRGKLDYAQLVEFFAEREILEWLRCYATKYKDEIKAGTKSVAGARFTPKTKGSFR